MSSLRASGSASCVPLANRPPFTPLLAHDAHDDVVHVASGEPDVLAHPALLDEAAGLVGPDRTLVRRVGLQPHAPEVPYPKRVIEDQPHGFAPVAAAPVFLFADSDAQFTVAGSHVEVEEAALPDALTVGLDGEVRLVRSSFPGLAIEPLPQPLEGDGQRRVAATRKLDLEIVPEPPQALLIFALYGPQRNLLSPQHELPSTIGWRIQTFGSS